MSAENTPLLPSTRSYVKVGLGGAGNYIPNHKMASSTPTPCPPRTEPTGAFYTGIGGAGNRASSRDRAFLSVEEDHERNELRRTSAATSWHHGIGGTGNQASSDDGSSRTSSVSSSSSLKSSGKIAERTGAADRIKQKIVEKWEARNQRVTLFQAWQRKLPTLERHTAADARSADSYDGFTVKC